MVENTTSFSDKNTPQTHHKMIKATWTGEETVYSQYFGMLQQLQHLMTKLEISVAERPLNLVEYAVFQETHRRLHEILTTHHQFTGSNKKTCKPYCHKSFGSYTA